MLIMRKICSNNNFIVYSLQIMLVDTWNSNVIYHKNISVCNIPSKWLLASSKLICWYDGLPMSGSFFCDNVMSGNALNQRCYCLKWTVFCRISQKKYKIQFIQTKISIEWEEKDRCSPTQTSCLTSNSTISNIKWCH